MTRKARMAYNFINLYNPIEDGEVDGDKEGRQSKRQDLKGEEVVEGGPDEGAR